MRRWIGVGFFLVGLFQPAVFAQTGSSTRDGVYTAEQALQGKALYDKQCAACHGAALGGADQSPPLTGKDFMANWVGQSAADLYTKILTTMPATQPSSLKPDETAALIAYILSANAFPAGTAALAADPASLKTIHIDAPPPPN